MKSCEEIQVICTKSQYRESSLWERIQLKMHLLICKSCAVFTRKNARLTALFQQSRPNRLSEEEKEQLRAGLRDRN